MAQNLFHCSNVSDTVLTLFCISEKKNIYTSGNISGEQLVLYNERSALGHSYLTTALKYSRQEKEFKAELENLGNLHDFNRY